MAGTNTDSHVKGNLYVDGETTIGKATIDGKSSDNLMLDTLYDPDGDGVIDSATMAFDSNMLGGVAADQYLKIDGGSISGDMYNWESFVELCGFAIDCDWTIGVFDNVFNNNGVLEIKESQSVEMFFDDFTQGSLPIEQSRVGAITNVFGIKATPSETLQQKVGSDVQTRNDDFYMFAWVKTSLDATTTGLTGISFGVDEQILETGYQVVVDIRNSMESDSEASFQLRLNNNTSNILDYDTSADIQMDVWYKIAVSWDSFGTITAHLYDESETLLSTVTATDSTYTSGYCGICCYSDSFFDDVKLGTSAGIYQLPTVDLSMCGVTPGSTISWSATTPSNTSVVVESQLSTDDGVTWGDWVECTNGDSLPGISNGTNCNKVRVNTRAVLRTYDNINYPSLESMSIGVLEGAV